MMNKSDKKILITFSNNLYEVLQSFEFQNDVLYVSKDLYNILLELDLIDKIKNKKLLKNIIIDYSRSTTDLSFDYSDNEKVLNTILDLY